MAITFDPNNTSVVLILSNANLTITDPDGGADNEFLSYATASKIAGKWYWELTYDEEEDFTMTTGICEPGHSLENSSWPGDTALSYGIYAFDGDKYTGGVGAAYGSQFGEGGVLMHALDLDNGEIWWGLDGVWFASGDPAARTNPAFTGISGEKHPCAALATDGSAATINFGATPFVYAPPVGFRGLQNRHTGGHGLATRRLRRRRG